MYPSEQRISHVAAGLWRHLYQCQHELEKYGANDLKITLPALFAMYHCAAGTVMQLGEEELADLRREFEDNVANLAEEDYVTRDQAAGMLSLAGREILLSLIFVFPVYALFLWVYRRVPKKTVL